MVTGHLSPIHRGAQLNEGPQWAHHTQRGPADPKEGDLKQATFTSLSPGLDRASTGNHWSCLFPPTSNHLSSGSLGV